MQQRRYRPGDVLDDYCPRERRITDHAIVAMIDDRIKQTRCVVCDAEHEYKDGKVPPQRRKKSQSALYSQVLDGLNGPHRPTRVPAQAASDDADELLLETSELSEQSEDPAPLSVAASVDTVADTPPLEIVVPPHEPEDPEPPRREEGPWRRQLIRAALPRPEGQPPPQQTRPATEFTIRQPNNARGQRHGRRRGAGGGGGMGHGGNGNHGAARFGRSGQGQGQGHGGRRRRGRGGKKNN
jgi:hypothetical protein